MKIRITQSKKATAALSSLLVSLILSGCSTGWPHRYDTLAPNISAHGHGKVVVVTRDQRPSIISGEQRAQHVGTVRSMYGEPWEVVTASGKPFAQDVSNAVCNGMLGRGFDCLPLISGQSNIKAEIDYLTTNHHPTRILYFTIGQWENDIYTKTVLEYDMLLDIWNNRGRALASVRVKGKDELPVVSYFNPAENASVVAPQTLERNLQLLLNSEKAAATLTVIKDIDELGANY